MSVLEPDRSANQPDVRMVEPNVPAEAVLALKDHLDPRESHRSSL